jgi:hypothetical protein
VFDFDVNQTFGRERGRSGRWVMQPVITATRAEAAGSIEGVVTLADGVSLPVCGGAETTLANFVPTAVEGEVSLSAGTDAAGEFRFPFVPAGTYTMGHVSEVVFANDDRLLLTAAPSVATAEVVVGGTATVDYSITAASCDLAPPDDD